MITLPVNGRQLMVGDRTVEGARQILLGEHRFVKVGGAWQPIDESEWQTNLYSVEITPTSILGMDGEEFDQSVPYGAELDELVGHREVALTAEQRDLIALTDMLNTVPSRKLEGATAEELIDAANEKQTQYAEANGLPLPTDSVDDEGEE